MSPWWVQSVTATSLVALAAALSAAGASADDAAFARLLAAVETYGSATDDVGVGSLARHCGGDLRCAAARVVAASAGRARLEPRVRPDTDTIRWVNTRPSVEQVARAGDVRPVIRLRHFGRKVVPEMGAILQRSATDCGLVLDLRANRGGDLGRMLQVAGLFTGARPDALFLTDRAGRRPLAIPGSKILPRQQDITVLVGRETASSGEVLAALLRRYADAAVVGERTAGKDYLYRVVPLDQDWRLLLPAERIEVPGESLEGGIRPDRALPRTFAAEVTP